MKSPHTVGREGFPRAQGSLGIDFLSYRRGQNLDCPPHSVFLFPHTRRVTQTALCEVADGCLG